MGNIPSSDIIKILQQGIIGLTFLFALLAFWLIQQRRSPRIISSFMIICLAFTALAILPTFVPRQPIIPPPPPDDLNSRLYPEVMTGIDNLLKSKPYVYKNRDIYVEFTESNDKSITITETWYTVVYNPTDTVTTQPQFISTTVGERFKYCGLYEYDEHRPNYTGRSLKEVTEQDYLQITPDSAGRRQVFSYTIPPKECLVTKFQIVVHAPQGQECAFLTNRIITNGTDITVDYSHMRHRVNFVYERALLPDATIDTIPQGGSSILYKVRGLQLPGNGFILEWH